jgi:hypothetical protein
MSQRASHNNAASTTAEQQPPLPDPDLPRYSHASPPNLVSMRGEGGRKMADLLSYGSVGRVKRPCKTRPLTHDVGSANCPLFPVASCVQIVDKTLCGLPCVTSCPHPRGLVDCHWASTLAARTEVTQAETWAMYSSSEKVFLDALYDSTM